MRSSRQIVDFATAVLESAEVAWPDRTSEVLARDYEYRHYKNSDLLRENRKRIGGEEAPSGMSGGVTKSDGQK
jgi:hypothetical protein